MRGPKTFTNYAFQLSVWGIIAVAVLIFIAAGLDTLFDLHLGFSKTDLAMAAVVVVTTVALKVVGSKVIQHFGGSV
jgi:hypothetical protein